MVTDSFSLWMTVCAALVGLASLALGLDFWLGARRKAQARQRLDAVLAGDRPAPVDAEGEASVKRRPGAATARRLGDSMASWGERVSVSRFGQMSLEDEDVRLLALCNFRDLRSRYIFLGIRMLTPLLLMAGVGLFWTGSATNFWLALFAAGAFGFLLPKWVLKALAARRHSRVEVELPWLLELLQLLMGVGLSVDQSLQLVINDFRGTAPVLADELGIANQQFSAGRSREQSLQRLVKLFDNDDLKVFVDLLTQIDRYGGSVQEPMKRFGDRLLEQRRNRVREKIGVITVKMSAVMILFLLPALLIVAGGPGFIGILRALGNP